MELNIAYSNWLHSQHIVDVLRSKYSGHDYYEAKNIIERYILSILNGIDDSKDKMIKEFKEKGLKFYPEIFEQPNISKKENLSDFEVVNGELVIGGFKTPITERMKYLCNKYGLYSTGIVYLKYDSILSGSQHWGIPWKTADVLYKYGFVNEGFSSPINSRLIDLPNGKYCSVFPDTDPDSLGSFFDIDLTDYPGNWSINPPMIETIIDKMVNKVLTSLMLHSGKAYFISMSNWSDMKAYKSLQSSQHLKKMQMLYRGTYYYQDQNKDVIKANFNSVYFVLADDYHTGFTNEFYDELYKSWSILADTNDRPSIFSAQAKPFTPKTISPKHVKQSVTSSPNYSNQYIVPSRKTFSSKYSDQSVLSTQKPFSPKYSNQPVTSAQKSFSPKHTNQPSTTFAYKTSSPKYTNPQSSHSSYNVNQKSAYSPQSPRSSYNVNQQSTYSPKSSRFTHNAYQQPVYKPQSPLSTHNVNQQSPRFTYNVNQQPVYKPQSPRFTHDVNQQYKSSTYGKELSSVGE